MTVAGHQIKDIVVVKNRHTRQAKMAERVLRRVLGPTEELRGCSFWRYHHEQSLAGGPSTGHSRKENDGGPHSFGTETATGPPSSLPALAPECADPTPLSFLVHLDFRKACI